MPLNLNFWIGVSKHTHTHTHTHWSKWIEAGSKVFMSSRVQLVTWLLRHSYTHTHTHTHLYFMSPHEVPPFPCPLSYLGLDALPFIQDKSLERGVSSAPCSKVYLLDSRHHLYVIDSQIHSPCTDLFFGSRPIASSLPHHLEISKVVRSTKEPNRTNSPGNQF